MNGASALRFSLPLFCACIVAGCAFGTRTVSLRIPPPAQSQNASITFLPFVDCREDTGNVVGDVRNTYHMRTADVVTRDPITDWVRNGLARGLDTNGFEVALRPSADDDSAAGGIRVRGAIETVYATSYLTYGADVVLEAEISPSGAPPIRRTYHGRGSAGLNWAATEAGYQESLTLALQDATSQFLEDIRWMGR